MLTSKMLRGLGIVCVLASIVSAYTPFWNHMGTRFAISPSLAKADSIVVLGAGLMANGALTDESIRRLVHGIQLFKQGFGSTLILSGPTREGAVGRSEAELRHEFAAAFGVPADRILIVESVKTTEDEAKAVASLMARRHEESILLVTEALHMRRAIRVFEKTGLRVFPGTSDDDPSAATTPTGRFNLMNSLAQQAGALLYYRLSGRV
jgi:uncharacterized SAM-binding protein YcdF (DUF218 family)